MTLTNNAAMSTHMQVYVFGSLGCVPTSGTAGSSGHPMFNILSNCQTTFQSGRPFYKPIAMYEGSNFSNLSTLVIVCLFHISHPSGCEMIPHVKTL